MVQRFGRSSRWGVYWRVLEPGTIQAGDPIRCVERDATRVPLAFYMDSDNWTNQPEVTNAILDHDAVHPVWKKRLREALAKK